MAIHCNGIDDVAMNDWWLIVPGVFVTGVTVMTLPAHSLG